MPQSRAGDDGSDGTLPQCRGVEDPKHVLEDGRQVLQGCSLQRDERPACTVPALLHAQDRQTDRCRVGRKVTPGFSCLPPRLWVLSQHHLHSAPSH